jgi:ketosteroid isomerase-like protein
LPIAPRLSALLAAAPDLLGGPRARAARIRTLYAALGRGDLAAFLQGLAPGVEWEEDRGGPGLPLRQRHLGRGAVARLLADPRGFARSLEIVHVVESGDEVAVLLAEGPAPEEDDAPSPRIEAHLWTVGPDGLVSRFRQVGSRPARALTRH